jgi:hypothetical protein
VPYAAPPPTAAASRANTNHQLAATYASPPPLAEDAPEEEVEEMWELTKVLSVSDLKKNDATVCDGDKCKLVACCVYISSSDETYFSCLRCQAR